MSRWRFDWLPPLIGAFVGNLLSWPVALVLICAGQGDPALLFVLAMTLVGAVVATVAPRRSAAAVAAVAQRFDRISRWREAHRGELMPWTPPIMFGLATAVGSGYAQLTLLLLPGFLGLADGVPTYLTELPVAVVFAPYPLLAVTTVVLLILVSGDYRGLAGEALRRSARLPLALLLLSVPGLTVGYLYGLLAARLAVLVGMPVPTAWSAVILPITGLTYLVIALLVRHAAHAGRRVPHPAAGDADRDGPPDFEFDFGFDTGGGGDGGGGD